MGAHKGEPNGSPLLVPQESLISSLSLNVRLWGLFTCSNAFVGFSMCSGLSTPADPSKTIFLGIEKYHPHWKDSSLVREISRSEMSWIYRIKSYVLYGLYVDVDMNAFIDNS